jgi:hypothetical protein
MLTFSMVLWLINLLINLIFGRGDYVHCREIHFDWLQFEHCPHIYVHVLIAKNYY